MRSRSWEALTSSRASWTDRVRHGLPQALSLSFEQRLGLLVLFFAVASLVELVVRGQAASRWREYLFVLACGTVGALFGVANDLVTSRISPEYFILGKGVPEGPGFLEGVIRVGIEAGFSGGAIAGCVLLYASRGHHGLVRHVGRILGMAALGSVAGWLACRLTPLSRVRLEFLPDLAEPAEASRFVTVWVMHLGIYAGVVAGLVRSWVRIRS